MSLSRLWSKFFKKNNDDFNNGKIYKIYKDINDVIYIGSTCFSLKKPLSNLKKIQNQDVIGFMIIFTIWFILIMLILN